MALKIRRVLVANRGEIAVRVIRAAKELGLEAVAVHSEADRDSLAVRLADAAVAIGPSPAAKSYLNAEAILKAAADSGADAVHPGYGFLSENASFAEAVERAGLVFVGPSPESIRIMGDKAAAREAAARAGVPCVPGSEGVVDSVEQAVAVAAAIGFPVMIKAAAGGGGRGIRVAQDEAELAEQMGVAQAEAQAAFGDRSVYLERFIRRARHVEVQVLGDGRDVIHCWERECSLQRRRQKIFEEAPSPALSQGTRERLCGSAVALARAVGYRGAGTLEYLFDDESGEFFFIEMNTRIQVEHPITEMITGIDMVREMLRIAGGQPLSIRQDEVEVRGVAMEARINAEDPERDFMPSPGRIADLVLPGGPGVRVDTMLYPGCVVSPFYDSLLAKVVVHAENREAAIARMRRALRELRVEGVRSTRDLHLRLLDEPRFREAAFDTGFLEGWLASTATSPGSHA
ncbi:MAG: acetyl-CoA carboxylase biotin carboxylase subunit [Betaproteobacteria bacterium]|jgi:acetyl-CoA carboxylase biotin carboxylase subunit|nr:acetyl-CoA carboxylase biotin carboxylase subunit [Rhodocyclaceae bacterium]MCA3134555.1 acetyl-CoA carboxylase biotin carboxylase subunit [Rhodocyclaceae bacterium]MCA3143644.1 acetyl-CoA carboxylase biotin carboxylase subunit [Rhodocyclaceae bacterium]MCA3145492.1 acetyl-CoA carboxylase biotin carboxylase subunit [Rhodocyclaceae bacterium]MCE2898926.1 acetyl-CoA carboxylase biotin carboxylase subunit [Betaproteobacteria bacterium]